MGLRIALRATPSRQPSQQPLLAIHQRTRHTTLDLPAPRIGQIERPENLPSTAICHRKEPLRITPTTPVAFRDIQHHTTRRSLDLIRGIALYLRSSATTGRNARTRSSAFVYATSILILLFKGSGFRRNAPAASLPRWAPPVATDPRQDP